MLLEVGRITKPHGVRGEVLVAFHSERIDRLEAGSVLQTERGELTIRSARPHQQRWIVDFEQIVDRTDADRWRGTVLLGEAGPDDAAGTRPAEDAEAGGGSDVALWVHELIGCAVELTDASPVGTVESVQANPAADLLVLDTGALVPVVFVVEHGPGRVVIDPPEGLLELQG